MWSVSPKGKLVGSVIAEDAESSIVGRSTTFEPLLMLSNRMNGRYTGVVESVKGNDYDGQNT